MGRANPAPVDLRHACRRRRTLPNGSSASARARLRSRLAKRTAPLLETLDRPEWWSDEVAAEDVREPLLRAAAWYYLRARTPPRRTARFGCALPSRQRRAARAAQFRRRYLRAGAAAIARFDGELPLRSRAHRAEPRGLCPAARRRCRQRGHAPASRRRRAMSLPSRNSGSRLAGGGFGCRHGPATARTTSFIFATANFRSWPVEMREVAQFDGAGARLASSRRTAGQPRSPGWRSPHAGRPPTSGLLQLRPTQRCPRSGTPARKPWCADRNCRRCPAG